MPLQANENPYGILQPVSSPPKLFTPQEHWQNKRRKKRSIKPFLLFIPLLIALSGFLFFRHSNARLVSPEAVTIGPTALDDGKVLQANRIFVDTPNSWKPNLSLFTNTILPTPAVSAKSALAMNFTSEEIYFLKNPRQKMPMASITKVMTALLALENAKKDELFTVSEQAAATGENAMGISAGEQYTLQELLYGLFLHSGNDAAEAIAENIAGNRQFFVALMNKRAKEIGMHNTNFTNASGLEGDGNMYTTVEDLAILSKYTLGKYPEILDITRTIDYRIPANQLHKQITLSGEIDLIRTYPGAIGFKTGFTDEAGRCIITIAENQGERVMVIVLGSVDRRVDAVKLLDYSYEALGIKIEHEPYW